MYEYQYISLDVGGGFWMNNMDAAHRAIIDREAQNGWRYVGYIPTEFTGHGGLKCIDLVFERPVE